MKKYLLICSCLLPLGLWAQQQFTVQGTITAPKNMTRIVLQYENETGELSDTAMLKNGNFVFKGQMGKEPIKAKLIKSRKNTPSADLYEFFLVPGIIKISITDSLKYAKIKGTQINADYEALKHFLPPLRDSIQYYALEKKTR